MSRPIGIRIAEVEARNLLALVDELIAVIDDPRAATDPGVARLTPAAYPGDDAASSEFRDATRDALIDRRRSDALIVRDTLRPLSASPAVGEGPPSSDAADLYEHRLLLTDEQADAWLRTLAAMRLVVASRMGIVMADDHDPADPRFGVYDWLGYRLELLVRAADERDLSR